MDASGKSKEELFQEVASLRRLLEDSEGRNEASLRRAQHHRGEKMEAIARLAGSVAHDLNNLLTVVTGFSELILGHLRPDDPAHEMVVQIKTAGERAAVLTRRLLTFARHQVARPVALDLNEAVAGLVETLRPLVGSQAELQTELAGDLPRVFLDPEHVEQILVALAANAGDAMPQGGTFTLQTRVLPPGAGRHVQLVVRDTGSGMSEEVRAHLFEPFFTTKESGRGTGLAAVYGLVKQAEGHVEVETAPGQGSAFFLTFPALEELPLQAPPPGSPRGSETVLLVEDETLVRDLARRAMVQSGYTVMEAAEGRQALAVSRRHAGPVHLLLTDVLMPHLSGPDLARQLTAERPGLRVLYISGYTDDAFAAHGGARGDLPYLQKPFTPQALVRKVREVLDG